MVKVIFYKGLDDKIVRYKIKGHADYDDYGKDIVCAAVSVLAQNTIMSMFQVIDIDKESVEYKIDDKTGFLDFKLKENIDSEKFMQAQILLKSLEVGVVSIANSYPKHVTLNYEGV